MASIYRRKKGGTFYITYQVRPRQRRTVKGCKDKAATEALARKLEADVMLRREGVIDVRAEKLAQWESLPIEDHLADYENTMRARGVTTKHLAATLGCIRMVSDACGFQRPLDLDPARVSAYVADVRRKGTGARTINARLTAFKAFTRWLFRTERMRTDPMMQVAKLNARTDRRRERRALADDEVVRLLHAAERGPAFRRLTGPDRAVLYRLAVETGLRKGEIASLTPASFNLRDPEAATVAVAAAYSKHRRDDVVPLRADLAGVMAAFIAGKPTDGRLFRLPDKPAAMLKADLRRARAWWIKEVRDPAERRRRRASSFLTSRDESGRVVDFHALRHTFITRLARSGVTPAAAKSLARHSTIMLTMDHYTHTLISDERAALDTLPSLSPAPAEREVVRATGTDGAGAPTSGPAADAAAGYRKCETARVSGKEDAAATPQGVTESPTVDGKRAAPLQRADAPAGPNTSSPAKTSQFENAGIGENGAARNRRKSKENRALVTTGHHLSSLTVDESAGAPPRTRTLDPLIKSQLLYQLS